MFPWLLFAPTIIYLVILTIFPLIYSLGVSLFQVTLGRPATFIGLSNYREILIDPAFWHAAAVTGVITIAAVTLEVVLGVVIGLILNRQLPGLGLVRLIVYFPMMLSPLVMGYFWRFMLDRSLGVVNWMLRVVGIHPLGWLIEAKLALVSIIMVDVWQWTPFVILLVMAGLQTVPPELYEISTLDRASTWMQFRRITLPFLRTPLMLAVLFRTIDTLKLFDTVFIMTGGGPGDFTQTLSVMDFKIGFTYFNVGKAAALSWLIVVIITVLATLLIQRLTVRPGSRVTSA